MAERPCPFCAIAAGDSDAQVVHETPSTVAFLDRRPVFKGHLLVIPRDHVRTLPDLPDHLLQPFFAEVRTVASALPGACDAQGTFVAMNNVISQSVPHLHCHVVPRRRRDGLRGFFWPRTSYAGGEAVQYAQRIRAALRAD